MKETSADITPIDSLMKADESRDEIEVNPMTATNILPPSKVSIDDFDIIKVIGRGTFGKVYLVKKKPSGGEDDGQVYAMKVLKKTQILQRNLKVKTHGKPFSLTFKPSEKSSKKS